MQTAELLGAKVIALRVWLDPAKLAAYGLTATHVFGRACPNNDYIAGLGSTQGQMVQVDLTARTGLHSLEEFRSLIVAQADGANIKLADVAAVSLGRRNTIHGRSFNGQRAVYIGIQVAPNANLLDVVRGVRQIYP